MLKRNALNARKGFTLVEVALAVAVGLIIIGGAVLGYNAVKDNASNSNARDRVLTAVSMVEEYASANGGRYPAAATGVQTSAYAGTFTTMWKNKRPDDYTSSPWGGQAGNTSYGVDELTQAAPGAGLTGGSTISPTAVTPAAVTSSVAGLMSASAVPGQAADMMYMGINTSAPWAGINAYSTSSFTAVKNYAVGIFDKNGVAWWDVKGGK